jgi:hypothetical protein
LSPDQIFSVDPEVVEVLIQDYVFPAIGVYGIEGRRDIWILKGDGFSISIPVCSAYNKIRSFIRCPILFN